MSDLLERLRDDEWGPYGSLRRKSADEIDRLTEIKDLAIKDCMLESADNERLTVVVKMWQQNCINANREIEILKAYNEEHQSVSVLKDIRIDKLESALEHRGKMLKETSDIEDKQAKRIAGLEAALERLAKLGNGDKYGNSDGNVIAQRALQEVTDEDHGRDCDCSACCPN